MSKKSLAIIRKNRKAGLIIKYVYYSLFKREKLEKRIGKKKGSIDYIVKPDNFDGIEGLLSLSARASLYIRYGESKGYRVTVDWKNYKTQYFDGANNAWEFFFKQPSQMKIEDAYRGETRVISGWTLKDINPNAIFSRKQFFDSNLNHECACVLNRLEFSDEVKKIVKYEDSIIDIEKCLGVYVRGTDYVKLRPSGEYVQPTVDMVIDKIDEFLVHYHSECIFLVTEDGEIFDTLKQKYQEKIKTVSFDSFIYGYDGKNYLSKSNVLSEDKRIRGINYLTKMVLLSKCRYLISSITMGSMFSYGLNDNKYADEYIFDLGLYD